MDMSRAARRVLFALFLVGTGGYAVVHLRGPDGLTDLQARQAKIRELRRQVKDKEAENDKLKKNIEKLSNRDHLDQIQRQEGKVPPGTVLFHVEEPKLQPASAR